MCSSRRRPAPRRGSRRAPRGSWPCRPRGHMHIYTQDMHVTNNNMNNPMISNNINNMYIYILYVCMYVCMHACMYASMYVCMHASMHVCMYVCPAECLRVVIETLIDDEEGHQVSLDTKISDAACERMGDVLEAAGGLIDPYTPAAKPFMMSMHEPHGIDFTNDADAFRSLYRDSRKAPKNWQACSRHPRRQMDRQVKMEHACGQFSKNSIQMDSLSTRRGARDAGFAKRNHEIGGLRPTQRGWESSRAARRHKTTLLNQEIREVRACRENSGLYWGALEA